MKIFDYERILTKEQLKTASGKKKKGGRADNWKYTLKRILDFVAEQKILLIIHTLTVVFFG